MSGDKAHYEQPIVFYSEYMTETKRVLIQLHEEEEEIVGAFIVDEEERRLPAMIQRPTFRHAAPGEVNGL